MLLRHGGIAQLRALEPTDAPALDALNARLSARSRRSRYFTANERSARWYVDRLIHQQAAGDSVVALVDDEVVAVASFSRLERDPSKAELAVLVDDAHQHDGLGALLLEHLRQVAVDTGVSTFVADVLLGNVAMDKLLARSGHTTRALSYVGGVGEIEIGLADSDALREAISAREEEAETASLGRVLAPAHVVVVGSSRPGTVGQLTQDAIREGGYPGRLDIIGRGKPVPAGADLVIVAVPAPAVLAVAEQAAVAGAAGLLVLSAGFAETAGRDLQTALLDTCRRHGMRLIGPNCLGIVNTDPAVRLNATFCDSRARPGRVAVISQSGAVGVAALRHAARGDLGLSMFVSLGNKADVSGNDLLAHLAHDERTSVIALYLESFGNPAKFVRLAQEVGRTKPVVVLKAGWSDAGALAGQSHTAAALTSGGALDAIMQAAGVLRVHDLPELFDVLAVLEVAPPVLGGRVAVIGNSGGPGVLAADACATAGLVLAELSAATTAGLLELLPGVTTICCPVDLLATATPQTVESAVALVLHDPGVDAVVAICTPVSRDSESAFAQALSAAAAQAPGTVLLATMPGVADAPSALGSGPHRVPFFEFPETAIHALGLVVAHAGRAPAASPAEQDRTPERLGAERVRARLGLDDPFRHGWLDPAETTALLADYAIPSVPGALVRDLGEALVAAERLGWPVALKGVGPDLLHKTDAAAVLLDLRNPEELRTAYTDLAARLGSRLRGALVQQMAAAPLSIELLVGLVVEESVGPLVLVAAGGVFTDLLDDRALRMPPHSLEQARAQVLSLHCAPRLLGHRNQPALDVTAVARILLSLADLAHDIPEVRELDINPLLVTPTGAWCLDARVRTGPPLRAGSALVRTLSPRPHPPFDATGHHV